MPDQISNPFFEKYLMGQVGNRNLLTSPQTTSMQDWLAAHPQARAPGLAGGAFGGGGEGPGSTGSGHDFGGARGPGPGARGPENATTHAVDALVGLAMGLGNPAFGLATGALIGQANPQATPSAASFLGDLLGVNLSLGGLLGGSDVSSGGGVTGTGGGGFGAQTGESGAAKGAATGTDASGLGPASGLGGAGADAGGGQAGGAAEGSGGISGGSEGSGFGGAMAKGGLIPGPAPRNPLRDNTTVGAQGGEFMLPRHAVELIGAENLKQIQNIANSAAPDHLKHTAIHSVLKRIANAGQQVRVTAVNHNPFANATV